MSEKMRFCRSRNDGRRCTRELGHRGLHRHRAIMWTDAGADEPHCAGSGAPASAAPPLASGFPGGRALCSVCLEFVHLDHAGRLVSHDTASAASEAENASRAEWFNAFGWTGSVQDGGEVGSGTAAHDGGEVESGSTVQNGGEVESGSTVQNGGEVESGSTVQNGGEVPHGG